MSKPLVLVTAPVKTRSGYGNHARDICTALIDSDKYEVLINGCRWGNTPLTALEKGNPQHDKIAQRLLTNPKLPKQPDLHIHIVIPNEFQPVGKKNIGITAGIETTIPIPQWLDGANKMDKVLFTSKFTEEVFKNAEFEDKNKQLMKFTKPSMALFEGFDPEVYKETNVFSEDVKSAFDKIDSNWNFLFVGHWLSGKLGQDRKDTGMLVKVFLESFKNIDNPPALIMKTSSAGFSVLDRRQMIEKINMIKDDVKSDKLPNVYLLHGDLTDEEINQMYNHPKVKTHLTFTHGEGFGRPLLEASFSGKPIIAPIATGQKDFLEKDYTIELPHSMTKVPKSAFPKGYFNPEALWATVDYNSASQIMRDVFKNYKKYELNGKKQMIVNRETFTHDKMKVKLNKIVDKILSDVPKEVSLKLPKMKKKNDIKLPKLKV